jgi:hypothetical protein
MRRVSNADAWTVPHNSSTDTNRRTRHNRPTMAADTEDRPHHSSTAGINRCVGGKQWYIEAGSGLTRE